MTLKRKPLRRSTSTKSSTASPTSSKSHKGIRGGIRAKNTPRKRLEGYRAKPKGKVKRRRKGELTKLKETLWKLCREITIKRYGNTCYSCGKNELWGSNLQCGHFITSSTCSVELRYSLDNLRVQCFHCNINLSGNWVAYERHLLADSVDISELKRRNEATKGLTYSKEYFELKIAEYAKMLQV